MSPSQHKPSKVFISYSHDSPEHRRCVLDLSERLRADGIDCHIDQYESSPPEGWPQWMITNIERADFLLVVCTETYARRVSGQEAEGAGLGARWEGKLIIQKLYEASANDKVIPVVFSPQCRRHIPSFLRNTTDYDLSSKDGYERLSRHLTNQPFVRKGALGPLRTWPTGGRDPAGARPGDAQRRRLSGRKLWWLIGSSGALVCLLLVAKFLSTRPPAQWERRHSLPGHSAAVYSVAFSPDGKTLASGSHDGSAVLRDAQLGDIRRTFSAGDDVSVYAVAFSPDGSQVAACGGVDVLIWDTATWAQSVLGGHRGLVLSVAFSPDGRIMATGSADRTVKLWDARAKTELRTLGPLGDEVNAVAISPDGKTVVAAGYDDTVSLWDAGTGDLKRSLRAHTDDVYAVAISPDGETLASGSKDTTVILWNARSGVMKKRLGGHSDSVRAVAFSPDGRMLASGGDDKLLILFDLHTGEAHQLLKGHGGGVNSVAFSADGSMLASGSDDKMVILWGSH